MVRYLVSALLDAWFAYRTGSLWMSIDLHWANNLGSSVLIGTDVDVIPSMAPVISNSASQMLSGDSQRSPSGLARAAATLGDSRPGSSRPQSQI